MVDADMARELAQLTELRNRQRVGGPAQATASRTPQMLLSLFCDD